MRIHQCPRCELRFRDEPQLSDHLVLDHSLDPEVAEQLAELLDFRHPRTRRTHRETSP
ncbi:MAG TPA: hypothetical protein VG452_00190 [Egibacteraceae bacterium]|nr:hypothetical protein [Actinomycetota bacterium]HWB70610.1 hypothetical protein [Egibacteraceae bacterium]